MILVGIIPGPKEPNLNINSYLMPLVLELKAFYNGVSLPSITKNGKTFGQVTIRLALMCIICDLPATRKVSGFVSFNALHGCSKCMKCFPTDTFGQNPDFSGYNTLAWPKRDIVLHCQKSVEYKACNTKSSRSNIEKDYGIRYSVLTELPYFNPIRYHVVDPMHNLFLGTAKRCMQIWINGGILSKDDLFKIERRVEMLKVPHSIGRLPLKISTGFSSFSADQWRNWTICFSPVALKEILPASHLKYWLLFVKACSLLSSRVLKKSNVHLAHQYLTMFCKEFETVNGKQHCTPNMHLHLHLEDCILDYGPLYAFWCYAFERYNGMLEGFPTNLRSIEPQLMKKCLLLQEIHSQSFPDEGQIFETLLTHKATNCGGLAIAMTGEDTSRELELSHPTLKKNMNFTAFENQKCLPPIKHVALDEETAQMLYKVYQLLYDQVPSFHCMSRFARKATRVAIGSELYNSMGASRENGTVVSAYWPLDIDDYLGTHQLPLSIGRIVYFIKHTLNTNSSKKHEHIFALVEWYEKHAEKHDWFGSSTTVCYVNFKSISFIPIQRITSVCIHGTLEMPFTPGCIPEKIFIAIPINNHNCY